MEKTKKTSMTERLIETLGLEEVENTWKEHGMYNAAYILSERMDEYVSPFVLRYMSNKYNWKREFNKLCPLYRGVIAGTRPAAYYKHLIFPGGNDDENNRLS